MGDEHTPSSTKAKHELKNCWGYSYLKFYMLTLFENILETQNESLLFPDIRDRGPMPLFITVKATQI